MFVVDTWGSEEVCVCVCQVANLMAFLCSDEAGFITGECVAIDGGVCSLSPLLFLDLGGLSVDISWGGGRV